MLAEEWQETGTMEKRQDPDSAAPERAKTEKETEEALATRAARSVRRICSPRIKMEGERRDFEGRCWGGVVGKWCQLI